MKRRDPDFYLSNLPLSPSRYIRPKYQHNISQPISGFLSQRNTTSGFHFSAAFYPRHTSKDLHPSTLPLYAPMDSSARAKIRRANLLRELKEKHSEILAKAAQTTKRKALIQDLSHRFQVDFTISEKMKKTEMQLTLTALKQANLRESEASSRVIQRSWREVRMQKILKKRKIRESMAARLIQRVWRRYIYLKTQAKRAEKSAVQIQRVWKGYKIRKQYSSGLYRTKLLRSLSNLQTFRMRVLTQSAQVIWYYWKKYRSRRDRAVTPQQRKLITLPASDTPQKLDVVSRSVEITRENGYMKTPRSVRRGNDASFNSVDEFPASTNRRASFLRAQLPSIPS